MHHYVKSLKRNKAKRVKASIVKKAIMIDAFLSCFHREVQIQSQKRYRGSIISVPFQYLLP